MPNWVSNQVKITGSEADIAKLKAQVSQPIAHRDGKPDEETEFAFWNIIRPPDDKLDEYQGTHGGDGKGNRLGETEYNWYVFNNREWGVKWDASDVSISEQLPTEVIYDFNTPWSAPTPVLVTLSKQYPDVEIEHHYIEEQGWGGVDEIKNGEVDSIDSWSEPNSHADEMEHRGDCWRCENGDQDDMYDDCPEKLQNFTIEARDDVVLVESL